MTKKLGILTLLTLACLAGKAQENQRLELTLKEAQKYALEHNRQLQNSSFEVRKSEAARWQTIATLLPQVSAQFDYNNLLGYKAKFNGMDIPMNPTGTFGLTASLTLSGAQIVGSMIGTLAMELSDISFKQTEQQTRSGAGRTYFSILVMEETLELLQKNVANMQKLLEISENSVKVGVSEQVDADKIAVQVASMKNSIKTTERSLEMLYNSLRLLLGVGVEREIVLTQGIDDILNAEAALQLLGTDLNLDNNLNYQMVKKNSEMSKQQITLAAMDYLPTVTGFYQYTYKTYFGKEEGLNMTPPNTVGVSLKIPIWSSGQRAAKITEKKLAYKSAQTTLDDTRDQLLVQDKQLRFNLNSAYESLQIQKENMEVSQRVFDNVMKKFEQGISSSLEVTNASTELISAQSNYVSATLDMIGAKMELENLLNK